MEFLKKNWIWILVAVIIIVALFYFFKKPERLGKATAFVPGETDSSDSKAITDIKTIIKLGVGSLEDLKQKALAKGYHVMSKEQAAVSNLRAPDPKRVVVSYIQPNCIMAPCNPMINVISIG
jgi:hypothetical protein